MAAVDPIRITGLRELQATLKSLDGEAQKELRVVLNDALAGVVSRARPLIPTLTGHAAASMKAQSSQREARIVAGGARAPYMPWLEFGGRVGIGKHTSRPFIAGGRYVFPTVKRNYGGLVEDVAHAVFSLIEKHGLDVT